MNKEGEICSTERDIEQSSKSSYSEPILISGDEKESKRKGVSQDIYFSLCMHHQCQNEEEYEYGNRKIK
jgi:hypothetical protein